MDIRLDYFGNSATAKYMKYLQSAGKVLLDSTLPIATQHLVEIRASQINGCGFCLDMHTKEAAHAGETSLRLNLVAAWREATVFTEAERAALELTEQGTRLADAMRRCHRRGLGRCRQAPRRGPARRPGVPYRPHQHLEPAERHHPAAHAADTSPVSGRDRLPQPSLNSTFHLVGPAARPPWAQGGRAAGTSALDVIIWG